MNNREVKCEIPLTECINNTRVRDAIKWNNPVRENLAYLADKEKELFAWRRNISLVSDQIRLQCRAPCTRCTQKETPRHVALLSPWPLARDYEHNGS